MQITSLKLTSLAAFLCVAVLAVTGAAQARSYTYTTLDNPGGVGKTYAFGINGSGDIVGFYLDSGDSAHGFLYNGATYTSIDDPDAAGNTYAFGVNGNGDIVGFYLDGGGSTHGFLYNPTTYTTLSVPGAAVSSEAYDVNDAGDIVGYYADNTGVHGFLYSGGKITSLDDPQGVGATFALGINDNGDIVGYYEDGSGHDYGFLYNGKTGAYTTLDNPNASGVTYAYAYAINDNGDIVGTYYDSSLNAHGFLYSGGVYTTLDHPDSVFTRALGINDNGDIVGSYHDSKGLEHGFLATPTGGLWQNAVATGGGWYYLDWLGSFNTNSSPWIYHETLGWLYPTGTSTGSIWSYDPQWDGTGGWWWTSSSAFPWVYSATEGNWYYYDAGDSNPSKRWFCNAGSGCALH